MKGGLGSSLFFQNARLERALEVMIPDMEI